MNNSTVFFNDHFCLSTEAAISIYDRGFLFGDSVYEVIPVYQNKIFGLERHIKRLNANLEKTYFPKLNYDWNFILYHLVQCNGGGNLQLYLQISRGNQNERKIDIPNDLTPTVVAFSMHQPYPTYEQKLKGMHATILNDIRWLRCDIKTSSLMANVLLNHQGRSADYDTTILVRDGIITEGSAANIFIVNQYEEIYTTPLDHSCLPGVTRQITLELARSLGLSVFEQAFSVEDLFTARELWLSSTTKELYPITKIDNKVIGLGGNGRIWKCLNEKYTDLTRRL